jgi:hypothetical protein
MVRSHENANRPAFLANGSKLSKPMTFRFLSIFTIPSSFLLIIAIELLFLWRGMLRRKRGTS